MVVTDATTHTSSLKKLYDQLGSDPFNRSRGVKCVAEYARQHPRPRKEGVVGPEPDYSFRYALIENDEFGRRGHFPTYKLTRALIQRHSLDIRATTGVRYLCAPHAKLETVFISDEGIRAWTRFANRFGVTFDGERRYRFPPKRVWNTNVDCINYITAVGRSKTHSRSPESAMRRAERRRLSRRLVRGPFSPVFDEQPICLRPALPCSKYRLKWLRSEQPYSVFKTEKPNLRVESIRPVRSHRGPIPDIVKLALNKIMNTEPIRIPKVPDRVFQLAVSKVKEAVQSTAPRGNLTIPKANYIAYRIRFLQSEMASLRETMEVSTSVRWYNANKLYEDYSSELESLTRDMG